MWNPFARIQQESTYSRKVEIAVLLSICIISIVVRFWYISGNSIIFSFDQARDAYLARQIFQAGDIKIQGPNASGTNDSIYHGVLFYYVIAPLYVISSNPIYPTILLIILSSLGFIPVFYLVKSLFKSQFVAFLTIALAAFSINHIQAATWLSNPTLALLTVPLFYLGLWKVVAEQSKKWLPWTALFLGLTIQSAVWFGYLCIVAAIFFIYTRLTTKSFKNVLTKKDFIIAGIVLLMSTSTMFVTQLKLSRAGIFTPSSLVTSLSGSDKNSVYSIESSVGVLYLFVEKMSKSFIPLLPLASVLLFGFSLFQLFKNLTPQKVFIGLWLFAPFALLVLQTREAQHLFLTSEIALYVIFSFGIRQFVLNRLKAKYLYVIGLSTVFILGLSQLVFATSQKENRINDFTLQTGMFLDEELAAIDWTYEQAQYKPFSIATYTAPYAYNTLWSYLYDWYGREKYGYVPGFFGMKQDGIFAGELLPHTTQPESVHFVFLEPNVGAPELIKQNFELEQQAVSTFSGQQYFGTLHVIQRTPHQGSK